MSTPSASPPPQINKASHSCSSTAASRLPEFVASSPQRLGNLGESPRRKQTSIPAGKNSKDKDELAVEYYEARIAAWKALASYHSRDKTEPKLPTAVDCMRKLLEVCHDWTYCDISRVYDFVKDDEGQRVFLMNADLNRIEEMLQFLKDICGP